MTVRKETVFVLQHYSGVLHDSVHSLGYGLGERGVVFHFPAGAEILLCMHQRSDHLWGHQARYLMCMEGAFRGGKAPEPCSC